MIPICTRTALIVLLGALPAVASTVAASTVPPTPIVVGIVLRESGPAFAVIQDPATSKTAFYGVGARLGAALVTEILADRVILVAGEQQTLLRLATPVSSVPAAAATAARGPVSGPGRTADPSSGGRGFEPPTGPYAGIATVVAGPGSSGGDGSSRGAGSADLGGGASQTGGGGATSTGTQNGLGATLAVVGRLHNGSTRQATEFSTTSLRDLLITMKYTNLTGSHRQRLELYAPDGSLYQQLSGAVAANTQSLIPVGGTWITEHALFGAWRVDVYVDRETSPIVSEAFTLIP